MRKLIAVLALSIAITGLAYAPPKPLEPPTVSIGDQLMEDVTVQSASVEHSYALVVTMEQSALVFGGSALPDAQNTLGAPLNNGTPTDRNIQHETNPSLLNDAYDLYTGGMISTITLTMSEPETSGGNNMYGTPEVVGPLPSRLSVTGVRLL